MIWDEVLNNTEMKTVLDQQSWEEYFNLIKEGFSIELDASGKSIKNYKTYNLGTEEELYANILLSNKNKLQDELYKKFSSVNKSNIDNFVSFVLSKRNTPLEKDITKFILMEALK